MIIDKIKRKTYAVGIFLLNIIIGYLLTAIFSLTFYNIAMSIYKLFPNGSADLLVRFLLIVSAVCILLSFLVFLRLKKWKGDRSYIISIPLLLASTFFFWALIAEFIIFYILIFIIGICVYIWFTF